MNNIIVDLIQFAQNQKICAVYFQSPNGLSNLKFHYLILQKDKWVITQRVLNDEKFFQQISKIHNIGKNSFLQWIHDNMKKDKYLHLENNLDIIITLPLN